MVIFEDILIHENVFRTICLFKHHISADLAYGEKA